MSKHKIQKEVIVTQCFNNCPFWHNSMDGKECSHPYWDDKEPYSSMIITHDNSKGMVPDECPLRKFDFVKTIKLEKDLK